MVIRSLGHRTGIAVEFGQRVLGARLEGESGKGDGAIIDGDRR